MNLFNLIAKLSLDDSNYTKGMADARQETEKLENSAEGTKTALDKQEKSTKEVGTTSTKTSGLISKLGTGIKGLGTIAVSVAGAITGMGAAIIALEQSTQDYTEDQNRLKLAFEDSGHSAETAEAVYKSMLGTLGESDRAIEAANHLAELTNNVEELAMWENITAGVSAKFGDSLPIEGLTEAANETAKTATVTGVLADALNWAGVNEDSFNASLSALNSEQERATLITQTLSNIYDELGASYNEANADIIESRLLNDELTASMSELGAIVRPTVNDMKRFGVETLNSLISLYKSDGLQGFVNKFKESVSSIDFKAILGNVSKVVDDMHNFAFEMIEGLIEGIDDNSTGVISAILDIVSKFNVKKFEFLNRFLTLGLELIQSLIMGVVNNMPMIIDTLSKMINDMATYIFKNLPKFVQKGAEIVLSMINGIGDQLPAIISSMFSLLTGLITTILTNLPQFLSQGIAIVVSLINGIVDQIPNMLATMLQLLLDLVLYLWENRQLLFDAGMDLLKAVVEGVTSLLSNMVQVGKDMVESIWDGVLSMGDWLRRQITDWFDGIWSGVKSLFGQRAEEEAEASLEAAERNAAIAEAAANNEATRLTTAGANQLVNPMSTQTNTRTMNFTQNITSARPLSTLEIAVNTKNALYNANWGLAK